MVLEGLRGEEKPRSPITGVEGRRNGVNELNSAWLESSSFSGMKGLCEETALMFHTRHLPNTQGVWYFVGFPFVCD